jgi:hypothetical protein
VGVAPEEEGAGSAGALALALLAPREHPLPASGGTGSARKPLITTGAPSTQKNFNF